MATTESAETSADTQETGTTVLFVDDEREILEMYDLLCRSEYEVETAATAEAALEQFGNHVDVAFFDRRMPDMSGDELVRAVRAEGYDTPIGMISAVDPEAGTDVDVDTYLTKPVARADLFDAIDEQVS